MNLLFSLCAVVVFFDLAFVNIFWTFLSFSFLFF